MNEESIIFSKLDTALSIISDVNTRRYWGKLTTGKSMLDEVEGKIKYLMEELDDSMGTTQASTRTK